MKHKKSERIGSLLTVEDDGTVRIRYYKKNGQPCIITGNLSNFELIPEDHDYSFPGPNYFVSVPISIPVPVKQPIRAKARGL